MSLINIALSGASAAQAALNTSSQNIANVMTPGYTRQGALLSAQGGNGRGLSAAGDGVAVSALQRFSDGFKVQQMWASNASLGYTDAGQPYLSQLEQVMSDDTSNINQGLDAFFAALNAASVQVDSRPLRDQVLTAADALSRRFNSMQDLLTTQTRAVSDQQNAVTDQINGLASSIALLNKKITAGQAMGVNTSGLQDSVDQSIDALSNLVGIRVMVQSDGSRTVSLPNGQPLVIGGDAGTLQMDASDPTVMKLNFVGTPFILKNEPVGGQLGGLANFMTQTIQPMQKQLLDLANGLATGVNGLLTAAGATDLNGNPGKPLFDMTGGRMSVVAGLNSSELAFSKGGGSGDSSNLLAIIGLRDQNITVGGQSLRMGDVFSQMVGTLGVQSQGNQAEQKTAQTVRDQSVENWKSTSGVNNDEEAVNLMQYQQMYTSNMQVVKVANELFDTLLGMI